MKLDAVYVTYWSLRDPLTRSQSLPVVRALADAGWRLGLVTFEHPEWALGASDAAETRRALAKDGIHWEALRYHKRPPVVSTVSDVVLGAMRCARLARRAGVRLFHGRGTVPAAVAYLASRLTGTKFLNDADGPLSQEYVDAGIWPDDSLPHRLTRSAEERFLRDADAVAVLTEARRQEVASLARGEVTVLPCAVDVDHFAPSAGDEVRAALGLRGRVLVYAGKSGGWYPTDAILDFVRVARDVLGDVTLLALTTQDPAVFDRGAAARGVRCVVRRATREEMPRYLAAADAGISFRRPAPSTTACSPVKNGEYLACGLPVVTTAGIGDYSDLVARRRVGVVVERLDEDSYRRAARDLGALLGDDALRARCRAVAVGEVSLADVVVPRYRALYHALLGAPKGVPAVEGS